MARKSSARTWLRSTWLSRLPLAARLADLFPARRQPPSGKRPEFPVLRPEVNPFETRFLPNDVLGVAQGAVFGSGVLLLGQTLLSPQAVLSDGLSGEGRPAPASPGPAGTEGAEAGDAGLPRPGGAPVGSAGAAGTGGPSPGTGAPPAAGEATGVAAAVRFGRRSSISAAHGSMRAVRRATRTGPLRI